MNEILREFLLETNENLAQLDVDLVTLEKDPREKETLSRVFRTLHTVKGTAGFLGLPKLQRVAHAAETLLSRLRAGELVFGPEIATALLGVVDAIRSILAGLEETGTEGPTECDDLIQKLESLTHTAGPVKPPPIFSPPPRTPVSPPAATPPQGAPVKPPPVAYPATMVSGTPILPAKAELEPSGEPRPTDLSPPLTPGPVPAVREPPAKSPPVVFPPTMLAEVEPPAKPPLIRPSSPLTPTTATAAPPPQLPQRKLPVADPATMVTESPLRPKSAEPEAPVKPLLIRPTPPPTPAPPAPASAASPAKAPPVAYPATMVAESPLHSANAEVGAAGKPLLSRLSPLPLPAPALTASHLPMKAPLAAPSTPVPPAPVAEAPRRLSRAEIEPPPTGQADARVRAVSDSALRVDVGVLDKLMTLVGELVLARNQILQFSFSQTDPTFLDTVQRLNQLTTELQAGIMKTRMQPIGNVWGKLPRLVRDLAVACEKQVRLDLDGHETELDKTIIEAIRDPLTHMVRNAIDHGIETPAQRAAVGKAAEGRLLVHAAHEGGKVVIEICDDGGGIDHHRVRDKAIANQILSPDQAARMTDQELINLIFLPGFSTTDRVTHFSGRGVGMDVVKTNIERIGGTVDVESQIGHGTTIRMKIPLTLAIIPALTITSGGDRYAIPQVSLLELVRLTGDDTQLGIERIHGTPVYRLRGNLLPIVYLHEQLQVESARPMGGDINVVILQADDRPFGLVVDDIHDAEEIVVKPLQKPLKGVAVYSGATIMGDGKVALILDVLGLAQQAGVLSGVREPGRADTPAILEEPNGNRQPVLLLAARGDRRMAIPLSQVARLEEFPRSAIERTGGRAVVQYRDEIMPLIGLSQVLGHAGRSATRRKARPGYQKARKVPVVVYAGAGRRVGLVVGRILDIVETTIGTRSDADRPGILFTAVVQGRVTEFLDIEGILRAAGPELFGPEPTVVAGV